MGVRFLPMNYLAFRPTGASDVFALFGSLRTPSSSTQRFHREMQTRLTSILATLVLSSLAMPHRVTANDAFDYNRLLGRGVNLGNALESPRGQSWGVVLKAEYFPQIKQAGFDSVRIPIRWSANAQKSAPFKIEEAFFQRVDRAVEAALAAGLVAVVNMHHYDEIFQTPAEHKERFIQLWKQIARHYQDYPDRLFFELLNEPHQNLTHTLWNIYLRDTLKAVRESNPDRIVIVGPADWNNVAQLPSLELPPDDRQLIVTFHYYKPFPFTHQGAGWVKGSRRWLGTSWSGTGEEKQAIDDDLDGAVQWAKKENRPLYLGEFGAYSKADLESRVRWTSYLRAAAEQRGVSWAYWEFAASFGIYDRQRNVWRQELLSSLIPANPADETKQY